MPDFEIEIDGAAGDYRVTARTASGESRSASVRFPIEDLDLPRRLDALEMALLRSQSTVRRLTPSDEGPVQQFGKELFAFAFPPEVRAQWVASRRRAAEREASLELRLRIGPPELAALPWEFLYDADRDGYLCLQNPFVRYLDLVDPPRPLRVDPPLRILAMEAKPAELDALDGTHERERLANALRTLEETGRVHVEWVEGQTWWDLQAALDRNDWHVFHFIGHGELDDRGGEGVVGFANDAGGLHRVPATNLALMLANEKPLRLVVLNSCDGARASTSDRFSSTATTLMRHGIPAVVAMQYAISDDAAVTFARGFYTALAAQLPVEQAVTRARQAMRFERPSTLEWATPVLHLRSQNGVLFDLTDVAPHGSGTWSESAAVGAGDVPRLVSSRPSAPGGPGRHRVDAASSHARSSAGSSPGAPPVEEIGARQATAKSAVRTAWYGLLWCLTCLTGFFALMSLVMIATGNYQPLAGSITATVFFVLLFVGCFIPLRRERRRRKERQVDGDEPRGS